MTGWEGRSRLQPRRRNRNHQEKVDEWIRVTLESAESPSSSGEKAIYYLVVAVEFLGILGIWLFDVALWIVRYQSKEHLPSQLRDRIEFHYKVWLPQSGEKLRNFPIFFHHVNVGPHVQEHEMITDVYLPLK